MHIFVDETEVERAVSGDNVTLKLKVSNSEPSSTDTFSQGVNVSDLPTGIVICSLDSPCNVSNEFIAEVRSLICS